MRKVQLGELSAHVAGGIDGNGGGNGPTVVLLHGFGAPGTDLVGLERQLALPKAVRWVFPMAPLVLDAAAPDTLSARAWWMIDMMALQVAVMTRRFEVLAEYHPEGLESARHKLESLLHAVERELGAAPEQTVLGGFSQGAMLALDTALHSSRPLAGLSILSGTVITRSTWRTLSPQRRGLPVFASHGQDDPVLPYELADELRQLLSDAGLEVDWVPFRGGHGVFAPVMLRLRSFLQRLFPEGALAPKH